MTPTDYTLDRSASPNQRYDALTQAIHWLSLVAIAIAFAIGLLLEDTPRGPGKTQLINLHASLGVLLLGLTAFRLGWRTFVLTPAPLGSPLLQLAGRAMHLTLYATTIAVPISGILMMSAKGRSFDVFGLFTVPPLMATDRAFGESLEEAHELLSYLMLILIGLHAAAAVLHQAVLKDGTLARMLPFSRTSSRSRKEDSA
ncbi:MAG: cytochrome b [Rhodoplanes sp.]